MGERIGSVTRIADSEFEERRERMLERVRRDGLSGYVLFAADYIQYFTGFWFLSNERPVIYAQSVDGEVAVFVPEFEVERTSASRLAGARRSIRSGCATDEARQPTRGLR